MKTLDEVIKAFECCEHGEPDSNCKECSYIGIGACCLERENDALHYLKQWQKIEDEYDELKDWWAEEHAENVPLTWDELKQMQGKPVWVDYESCNRKAWTIVDCFYTDAFLKDRMNVALPHDYWHLEKEMIGKTWNAYRKERK